MWTVSRPTAASVRLDTPVSTVSPSLTPASLIPVTTVVTAVDRGKAGAQPNCPGNSLSASVQAATQVCIYV